MKGEESEIMTVAEVAEMLRVHRSTVSRYSMSGELVSHRIGDRRLFKPADVGEFFEKGRVRVVEDSEEVCSYSLEKGE